MHLRRIETVGILPLLLGKIHGSIGILKQGADRITINWPERDTDAAAGKHLAAIQLHRS